MKHLVDNFTYIPSVAVFTVEAEKNIKLNVGDRSGARLARRKGVRNARYFGIWD